MSYRYYYFSLAERFLYLTSLVLVDTGARCVRKKKNKKKYYIILQGGELACFHFLSRRVKLIVTTERLNIFKKCFHQSKDK